GLTNAPATFERMVDSVLRGLKWNTCLCYLDDILVFGPTFDVHLDRVREVLTVMKSAGLTLNAKKCYFGQTEIKVLGHVVSSKGISPDPDKISAVQNFPQPRSVNEVQSFLGLCSYFRRFIQNFSKRVCHMRNLLQKHVMFEWTPAHSQEFLDLKDCLSHFPLLGHYNP